MTESNSRLLTDEEFIESGPPEAVRLPLDLVDFNPNNPRAALEEVDALADNIRQLGLQQPVTVRRAGERYELLGGHRRRAAFGLLREREPLDPQWRTIPAVVKTANNEQADLMLISGQIHVRAWKPREEAAALERMKLGGMTLRQIGDALNKTEAWASKRLRVYADAVLSGYVQTGKLNTGVAEIFLAIKDPKLRKELAERAVTEGWAQQQAQAALRKLRLDSQLRDIAKRASELADLLGAIDPSKLPTSAAQDLWLLHGRIEVLSGRRTPRMPTIEQAERAAGVRSQEQPARGGRRRKPAGYRPGYKPKLD